MARQINKTSERQFLVYQSQPNISEQDLIRIDRYVKNDREEEKSFARRLVDNTFSKLKWYNPNKDKAGFDLERGWAFYDHFTLARYDIGVEADHSMNESVFKRTDPDIDRESKLYGYFKTSSQAFSKWGIGVALYFNTLRVFSVTLCLAGIISIPNMLFFRSTDYHTTDSKQEFPFVGSAVCETKKWVTCETDYCDLGRMRSLGIEYATLVSTNLTFVSKSLCKGATPISILNSHAVVMSLAIFTFFFVWYQKKHEDLITASDYSIHVMNPPPDATDPSEWRTFFMRYAEDSYTKDPNPHVAGCTIILKNELLIRQLINRRICRNELQKLFPHKDIDDTEAIDKAIEEHKQQRKKKRLLCLDLLFRWSLKPILNSINRYIPAEELKTKIEKYDEEIEGLQADEYTVSDVFITFETVGGQKRALECLQRGKFESLSNHSDAEQAEDYGLFRGKYLDVEQAEEPCSVRYLDLAIPPMSKRIRVLITTSITIGLVAISAFLVNLTRKRIGVIQAGILTSVLNLIVPHIVRLLLIIEKHDSEGEKQRSSFTKITIYRWFITVIMVRFLTDFTATLGKESNDLLPAVSGIFVAEMFLVPVLRYLDIGGFLSKHYFAPRAATEGQMYLCFTGTAYSLAERYSDLTKVLLLSYYYCAIFPATLLFGSLTLILRYYVDKYCLLRTWQPAPYSGTKLADFNSRYFLTLAISLCAIVSAYDYVYFPYDHVCNGKDERAEHHTNITVEIWPSGGNIILASAGGSYARVCTSSLCCQQQNFWKRFGVLTPWKLENDQFSWMSNEQKPFVTMYAITGFCFLLGFITIQFSYSLFRGKDKLSGKNQNKKFSSLNIDAYQNKKFSSLNIDAYIPQIHHDRFPFPLILCDIKGIDQSIVQSIVGWADPNCPSYDNHNCTLDIRDENSHLDDHSDTTPLFGRRPPNNKRPIFSIAETWKIDDSASNNAVRFDKVPIV